MPITGRVQGVALAVVLGAGCGGRESAEAPGRAGVEPASGKAAVAPIARRADGFESGTLAAFWVPGNYGTGRYEPAAIVVSDVFARSGKRSARITVKEGDVQQLGDDGQQVERAELDSGHLAVLGRDVWYGFSVLLPKDFPIVDNRLVIAQCKQSDVEGSPLIGQRLRNGRHTLTIRAPGAFTLGSGKRYTLPELVLGRWVDMVYHVRYASGADGRIEIWMDGKRVVSYDGPTASTKAADRFYHKVGLYRDRWREPMVMYLDNYTLGNSFDEVDPARFAERAEARAPSTDSGSPAPGGKSLRTVPAEGYDSGNLPPERRASQPGTGPGGRKPEAAQPEEDPDDDREAPQRVP